LRIVTHASYLSTIRTNDVDGLLYPTTIADDVFDWQLLQSQPALKELTAVQAATKNKMAFEQGAGFAKDS